MGTEAKRAGKPKAVKEVDHAVEFTQFGFRWGPIVVSRLCSDDRFGFEVEVRRAGDDIGSGIQIHATPRGRKLTVVRDRKSLVKL